VVLFCDTKFFFLFLGKNENKIFKFDLNFVFFFLKKKKKKKPAVKFEA